MGSKWEKGGKPTVLAIALLAIAFMAPWILGFVLAEYDRSHRPPIDWKNLPPLPRNYGEKVEYISGHEYIVKGSLVAPQYIHSPECLKCSGRR